jgi:hypothetical protein
MSEKLPEERWWQALDELAGADIAPLEITDRRILKAAAQAAPRQKTRRWVPMALAASLAVGAVALSLVPRPAPQGGEVLPADAGPQGAATGQTAAPIEISFAPGSAAMTPRAREDLAALASQADLCAPGGRLTLRVGGDGAARGKAIAEALGAITAGHCRPAVALVAGQSGDRAVITWQPAP